MKKGERRALMIFAGGGGRFFFSANHFVDVVVSSELASRLLLPPPLLYLDQMLWRLEMLSTLWKKRLEKSREIDVNSRAADLVQIGPPPEHCPVSAAPLIRRRLRGRLVQQEPAVNDIFFGHPLLGSGI